MSGSEGDAFTLNGWLSLLRLKSRTTILVWFAILALKCPGIPKPESMQPSFLNAMGHRSSFPETRTFHPKKQSHPLNHLIGFQSRLSPNNPACESRPNWGELIRLKQLFPRLSRTHSFTNYRKKIAGDFWVKTKKTFLFQSGSGSLLVWNWITPQPFPGKTALGEVMREKIWQLCVRRGSRRNCFKNLASNRRDVFTFDDERSTLFWSSKEGKLGTFFHWACHRRF